jgi:hypothetical protein
MTESDPGQASASARGNPFERVAGALFAPVDTFEGIARKPDFVVPILLLVVVAVAYAWIIVPRLDYDSLLAKQHERMRASRPDMTDRELETIDRFTKASTKVGLWVSPVLQIGVLAVITGVLFLLFRLFGGGGTYAQAFSATLYGWIPMAIKTLVVVAVVLGRGSFDPMTAAAVVKSSPAFLADPKAQPVLFALLGFLDLFVIWMLILLTLGYAAVSRFSRARSAVLIGAAYAVVIGISVGFVALTSS